MTSNFSCLSKLGVALAIGAWLSDPALAQATDPHAGHTMVMPASVVQSASNAAYEQVNAKMHKDMGIPLTGDADRDFLAGMIPHHQGAVEMAQVELKYGKDPKVKKLAQEVITAQTQEITMMQSWLKELQTAK